jgi:DNA-binding transcriptional MerR regulator
LSQQEIPKLYYSIGQVSLIAQVDQHVLRYWETEFKELAPRKNRGGKRLYREGDIKTVQRIKELLYRDRYTIEGARKKLKEEVGGRKGAIAVESPSDPDLKCNRLISEMKIGLVELKDLLKN